MSAKRHKTSVKGIYYVEAADGARSYIATWREERPLDVSRPLSFRRRRVEQRAASFDEACRLKAAAETASGRRPPSRSVAERMMAAKWFEYWVRR